MSSVEDLLVEEVLNTVGYSESDDKAIFMAGAKVGISKAMGRYLPQLRSRDEHYGIVVKDRDRLNDDLRTIVDILNRYNH